MIIYCSKKHPEVLYEVEALAECPICEFIEELQGFYEMIIDKYASKEAKEELELLKILEASDE